MKRLAPDKPRDFRVLLQEELLERCRKNPRYSLRSFAQSLRIGSSDLSKIIHGKRSVTEATMLRLGKRLELEPELLEDYRTALATGGKRRRKGATATPNATFTDLNLDTFHIISDWYPLAILEMIKVKGFVHEPQFIARCLGVTVSEVTIAIERLVRLGMVDVTEDGRFVDLAGRTSGVTEDYTDLAKRRYQKQILEKASAAVDEIPMAQRDQSSILMAVDTRKLGEAKAMIKDFRRRLCDLLEEGGDYDQVMFLSVSLFPLLDPKSLAKGQRSLEGELS